jgi:hypothetical protein
LPSFLRYVARLHCFGPVRNLQLYLKDVACPIIARIIGATASHIHQGVSVVMICFRISSLQLFSDGYGLTAVARANIKAPRVYEACHSRGAGDPVATGLAKSLSRAGGNITGISDNATELSTKRLSLLKQLNPIPDRAARLSCCGSIISSL